MATLVHDTSSLLHNRAVQVYGSHSLAELTATGGAENAGEENAGVDKVWNGKP